MDSKPTTSDEASNNNGNKNSNISAANVADANDNNNNNSVKSHKSVKSQNIAIQFVPNQPITEAILMSPKILALREKCKKCIHCLQLYSALLVTILVPILCITPYLSALYHKQVEPIFPMVSDVGSQPPQAAFFSQMLDCVAVFAVAGSLYRFRTVNKFILQLQANSKQSDKSHRSLYKYNLCSQIIIVIVATGICIIGNFRSSEALIGHIVGVVFAFFGALLFMVCNLVITKKLSDNGLESKPISMIVISLIGLISMLSCMILEFASAVPVKLEEMLDIQFRLQWKSDQPGYVCHMLGSYFEWFAINSFSTFFCCLFNRARINHRRIRSTSIPSHKSNINSSNSATVSV